MKYVLGIAAVAIFAAPFIGEAVILLDQVGQALQTVQNLGR